MNGVRPETPFVAPAAGAICAIIVTYHPTAQMEHLLQTIALQVGRIVIVDNFSSPAEVAYLSTLCLAYDSHLIENEANLGIARAMNIGVRYAVEKLQAEWVVFFDQDTHPYATQMESLLQILREHPQPESLGVVGSNYVKLPAGALANQPTDTRVEPWMPQPYAITSGALISLRSFAATGGFRDEFFIDCVDFDYSFKARCAGYATVITRAPVMAHTVGAPVSRSLGRWRLVSSNHRAERRYYRVRNVTVLTKEYGLSHPRWILPRFRSTLWSILVMCWVEKDRPRKLRYVARGLFDGLRSDFRYSPLSEAAPDPRTAKQTLRSS